MSKEKRHPSWWQLWLLVPALGVLGYFEARVSLSATGHRIVEVAIVLAIFGSIALWLRANEGAFLRDTEDGVAETARREVETPVMLPPDFTIAAGSNGNGHRRSAWMIPVNQPQSAAMAVDPEEQDA